MTILQNVTWLASFRLLIDEFPGPKSMLSSLADVGHLNFGKKVTFKKLKEKSLESRSSWPAGRMAGKQTK